jgi:hypothetical protein
VVLSTSCVKNLLLEDNGDSYHMTNDGVDVYIQNTYKRLQRFCQLSIHNKAVSDAAVGIARDSDPH